MRVLHIGSGNLYGGVETLLVTLAKHRRLAPSMEPEFTVCFDGRLRAELATSGARVHSLGGVRVRNPFSVWKARRNLRDLLSGSRFDVVICHSGWTQAIFGPVVRQLRVPFLRWMHSPATGHWLERWAWNTTPEFVICNSHHTAKGLDQTRAAVRSAVVYYPVSAPDPAPASSDRPVVRREMQTTDDSVVIIQVSRMEQWKGHSVHLEALARMREVAGWTCWIVGDAQRTSEQQYFEKLQRAVNRFGIIDRVRFLGARSDVGRLLAGADIFCQPNIEPEPFGIVFVEALWAGLPVVTTAVGGGAEIAGDGCGILVPPSDAVALAGALKQLVAGPEIRHRLSQAGSRRASELCAPSRQLPHLAEVIQRAVGRRIAA